MYKTPKHKRASDKNGLSKHYTAQHKKKVIKRASTTITQKRQIVTINKMNKLKPQVHCPSPAQPQHILPIQQRATFSSHINQYNKPFDIHSNKSIYSIPPTTTPILPHQQLVHNHHMMKHRSAISSAFRQTKPQQFVGRVLIVAGAVAMAFGARYIARGGAAFIQAYKNTTDNLKPIDEQQMEDAAQDIANAARDVMDREVEEQKEDEERQNKENQKQYEKENPKENPNAPKFYQDDFSAHIDPAAVARRKQEQEEKLLNKQRYESNEEELNMNEIIDKYDLIFAGGGDGFALEMTLLEAESILGVSGNPSIEELKDRRAILMRLNHPDLQGSPFLASKVNEAYELLLPKAHSDPTYNARKKQRQEAEIEARKEALRKFEEERLKKEGKLDQDGDFAHPDGTQSKRFDESEKK